MNMGELDRGKLSAGKTAALDIKSATRPRSNQTDLAPKLPTAETTWINSDLDEDEDPFAIMDWENARNRSGHREHESRTTA